MYVLELSQFSRLNEAMKNVVHTSSRISTLALNARFMIRSHRNKGGFERVVGLIRDFSNKLNKQMADASLLSNSMLAKAAKYKVQSRYDSLIEKALSDHRAAFIRESYRAGERSSQSLQALQHDQDLFKNALDGAYRLIGEAETLAVLTKIEVRYSDIESLKADNLTRELDETIYRIDKNIHACTQAIII
ncbi:MAG: hypothetical protein OEY07_00995 [Gammaproteobacteria bacterium]|nr:hypothetical protein [Gammaproteobacteria bacterium]